MRYWSDCGLNCVSLVVTVHNVGILPVNKRARHSLILIYRQTDRHPFIGLFLRTTWVSTGWMLFLTPNQQYQSTGVKANLILIYNTIFWLAVTSGRLFTARRSYASLVLVVVILSVSPSVRLSHACFVTNPKNLPAIFLYHTKEQSF